MKSVIESIEQAELVEKLKKHGYLKLIELLLNNPKVYTKKGRLNKSSACRILKWKPKELEDALEHCREVLNKEFD